MFFRKRKKLKKLEHVFQKRKKLLKSVRTKKMFLEEKKPELHIMSLQPVRRFKKSAGKQSKQRQQKQTVAVQIPKGFYRTVGTYGRYSPAGKEKKFFDTQLGFTVVNSVGNILSSSLNLIKQGTGQSEMLGYKCTVRKILLRACMRIDGESSTNATLTDAVAALTPEVMRFMIVLDKQCNGTAPTVAEVFDDFSGGPSYLSFNKLSNSRRFKILHSKEVSLPIGGCGLTHNGTAFSIVTPAQDLYHEAYINCNIVLDFQPQAGAPRALAEVRSNNLFVLAISTSGSAKVAYNVRLRYDDA